MAEPVRLGIAGAGLIGRRHAEAVNAAHGVVLAGIADPAPAAQDVAAAHGVPCHPNLEAMLEAGVDGVILATPNQLHEEGALAAIGAGVPVLVEKPIAGDLAAARRMTAAARAAGVPLAVGHHRRHNPLIRRASQMITEGALGQIVLAEASCWLMKPDDYFQTDWRRRKGAGPVYLNLIHDVDLLLHLCGPATLVQAMESAAARGFEVEDTAVILLRFASGALATMTVTDTVPAPWSWELTARENPAYPPNPASCYRIGGTQGSLELPDLALWHNPGKRSWWEPLSCTRAPVDHAEPLAAQAAQFGQVIRDGAAPLVSGEDGLAALEVIEAVKTSAATGQPVMLGG